MTHDIQIVFPANNLVAINLGSNSQCWVIDLVRTHHRAGYAFIGLWLIGFFGLTLLPMAASLYFVFTDYDILTPPRWIGVANFRRMFFEDARYLQSVTVTTFYVAIAVPVRLAFALAIAMLVNTGRRGVSVYRAAYYAPSLVARSLRHSVRPTLSALFG